MHPGADYIFGLKLLWGGQQQRSLHQNGSWPGPTLHSVPGQPGVQRAQPETKVKIRISPFVLPSCSKLYSWIQMFFLSSGSLSVLGGRRDQHYGLWGNNCLCISQISSVLSRSLILTTQVQYTERSLLIAIYQDVNSGLVTITFLLYVSQGWSVWGTGPVPQRMCWSWVCPGGCYALSLSTAPSTAW